MHALIRYKVKPEHAATELNLLHAVFDELERDGVTGVRYASFRLPDGLSFVEVVEADQPGRFSELESFRRYRSTLDERCSEPPVVTELNPVGVYP